jgi:hypothetical protein
MRYRILPYRQGSVSARALAHLLGGLVLKLEGSKYRPKADDLIINWGNTVKTFDFHCLNPVDKIKTASNKLKFFNTMKGAGHETLCPRYFDNSSDIPDDVYPVLCRTSLSGHSGEGIVIANTPEELVPAPLYVAYVKKQDEYRIHVGKYTNDDGTPSPVVISQQRKARRLAVPDDQVNWQIRNHANGFVYTRGNISPPPAVVEAAITGFMTTGLDFGAVDVIWNEQQARAYVLEINTAPGLEGQTIADYAAFFVGDL